MYLGVLSNKKRHVMHLSAMHAQRSCTRTEGSQTFKKSLRLKVRVEQELSRTQFVCYILLPSFNKKKRCESSKTRCVFAQHASHAHYYQTMRADTYA